MAKSKPRRPTIGCGLPPPPRRTHEEEAEDERLRAEILVESRRIDAIIARKRREGQEWQRLRALQQAEATNESEPWS